MSPVRAREAWLHREADRVFPGPEELAARRDGRSVCVLVPARNEEATVGSVVSGVVDALVRDVPLVDEVVVVDGRSTDRTAELAARAGARVLTRPASAYGHDVVGKGGALWWAQFQTDADLLVFLDADVAPSRPETVVRLLTPLLLEPRVSFVKAAFDRPLVVGGVQHPGAGGRVTELMARPLLNAWWPELAGFVQPLSGEVALRRELCEQLAFSVGYGLEIGMLVDAYRAVGLEGMAQVDIGERVHRHHTDRAVGVMSAGVLSAALERQGTPAATPQLVQFARVDGSLTPTTADVPSGRLPAAVEVRTRTGTARAS